LTLASPAPPAPAEVAQIDVELAALEKSGIADGPAVESLRARRDERVSKAGEARSTRTRAIKDRAVALVKRAAAGDEPARAEIEALARRQPRSFPQDFPEAIAAARFDRAIVGRLAAALPES
jgi:hypothetical protein